MPTKSWITYSFTRIFRDPWASGELTRTYRFQAQALCLYDAEANYEAATNALRSSVDTQVAALAASAAPAIMCKAVCDAVKADLGAATSSLKVTCWADGIFGAAHEVTD